MIHKLNWVLKAVQGIRDTKNRTEQQKEEYKRQVVDGFLYIAEYFTLNSIQKCKIDKSCDIKLSIGFRLHDLFNVGEQSVLKSIKDAFEGENMPTHCNFYGYKINLYLQGYKLAIEIDELDQNEGIINHEIEKKAIKKELGCEFIRINPGEQNFNIFKSINKMHRDIKRSSKK